MLRTTSHFVTLLSDKALHSSKLRLLPFELPYNRPFVIAYSFRLKLRVKLSNALLFRLAAISYCLLVITAVTL